MKKAIKLLSLLLIAAVVVVSCTPRYQFYPYPNWNDNKPIKPETPPVNTTKDLLTMIDNAVPGTPVIINLAEGEFPAQLNIKEGTDVTIIGQGEDKTVISIPDDVSNLDILDIYDTDNGSGKFQGYIGIIQAKNAKIRLEDLTIKGDETGVKNAAMTRSSGSYSRQAAIMAINTEVYAKNVTITDMRYDNTSFGVQNGISVYLVGEGTGKPAYFENCTISNFNKGAIVARASVSHLTFINGEVIGEGQTNATAQNGIQFSCPATITGNTFSNIWFVLADGGALSSSVGIFNYGAPSCTINNNTFKHVNQRFSYANAPEDINSMIQEDTVSYYLNSISKTKLINALTSAITNKSDESAEVKASIIIPDNISSTDWNKELAITFTFTNSTTWAKTFNNGTADQLNGSVTMTLTGGSIAADNTTLSFTGYELSSEEGLTFGEDAITFSGIKGGIAASATISNSTLSSPAFSNITLPADGTGITLKLNNEDVSYDNVINQLDASTSV